MKEGYKKTELGWIPEEWKVETLGNVVSLNPETLRVSLDDGGIIEYIDIESVKLGKILGTKKFTMANAPSRAKRIVRKDDVIVSNVRPNLRSVAQIDIDKENLICSTGFSVLRKSGDISAKYLFQYVLSDTFTEQLINKTVGSNYPAVNTTDVKDSHIIIPPLKEQQKIAEILSTVDTQIDNIEKIVKKTKELKKGLMQKLLTKGIGHSEFKKTELGEIPVEWEVRKLGKVVGIKGGYAFKSSDTVESGVRWLKIANVSYDKVIWESVSYLPNAFLEKYSDYSLKKDDFVLALTRPIIRGLLKISQVKEQDVPALLNQRVGKLEVQQDVESDLSFIYYVMSSKYYINRIEKEIAGTDPPNVSIEQLENIEVVVPQIEEQQKIASILSSIDQAIENYQSKKEKLQELKKGLMQKLLTGEIRVN